MNIWNVVFKQNNEDTFDVSPSSKEKKLVVNTSQHGFQETLLSTNVFTELKKQKITPCDNLYDLLHFAIGVYTVDQGVSREKYGFQGWSRHFKLFVPVSYINKWNSCRKELEKMLSFLSGDKWEISFRSKIGEQKKLELQSETNLSKVEVVSLFSGGMDSFIGAIDLLEEGKKVHFVSHYKRGAEGNVQPILYNALKNKYGEKTFQYTRFWVQPTQKNKVLSKERTSRARSFLFICLGITIANSLGQNVKFIIPENGLISLNVPLTGTRLSSHSTRTTHPYYLDLFKKIINKLDIKNPVINPYQFYTKGEMVVQCRNLHFFKKWNKHTLSCSHPDNSRRKKGSKPGIQCGYCVPCIIRQASERKIGFDETEYVYSILKSPPSQKSKSGSDIRAFKLALERLKSKSNQSIMFDILNSGPLFFDDKDELNNYIYVYKRGMNEVKDFLSS